MLNKLAIKLVKYLLTKDLTIDQRNELIVHILDNLSGLPISGIINVSDDGEIQINNRSLDIEKIKQLRESARVALDNQALKLINQEVQFAAVVGGIHKATNSLDLYFYRAALWYGQQQILQLKILAQRQEEINN